MGLTTGACLAPPGHRVVCADIDAAEVEMLIAGNVRISEPGPAELVREGMAAGRLGFVVGAAAATAEPGREQVGAHVVFRCVPTPMGVGGVADPSAVEAVVEETRELIPTGCVVVDGSTVPVGTLLDPAVVRRAGFSWVGIGRAA